jgi:hypothetical protein
VRCSRTVSRARSWLRTLGHGGLLEGAGLLEVKLVELQADEVAVLPAADEGMSDHHQVDTYVAQVP